MAILQISKIQQRSGNLVDLPQLDEAEFGWASDAKRLFIGKTTPNENIEVLTSYSSIDFSQINGTVGNLSISNVTVANGQVLAYDGTNWVNRGGDAGGLINLGDVANVKITGGAIGYVLETDGIGNLTWTPKSTVTSYIQNVKLGNGASGNLTVVTTTQDNFFVQGAEVTITNVTGTTQLNGNAYFVGVETSNSFALYTDAGLTTPLDSSAYGAFPYATVTATDTTSDHITVSDATPFSVSDPVVFGGNVDTANTDLVAGQVYYVASKDTVAPNTWITVSETVGGTTFSPRTKAGLTGFVYVTGGRAISTVSGGGGSANAGGSQNSVQYNNSNLIDGDTNFTWDFANTLLTVSGNANISNVNSSGVVTASRLISNIATGTAPITVTSTTRVANLNVSYANVSDFQVVTAQTTGTYYPVLVNNSGTGNRALGANANISFNVATGNLSVTLLSVTSNANVGNLGTSGLITATGNVTGGNLVTSGALSVTGNATVGNLDTAGVLTAIGNVTGGNLVTAGKITATGNANVGNLGTTGFIDATGNIAGGNLNTNGIASIGGNANITGSINVTTNANITANLNANNGAIGNLLTVGANANVTGNVNVTANIVANNGAIGNLLTVGANANVTGNVNVVGNVTASRLISNIATGTAPLTVTSTTRVANLSVAYANVSDFASVTTQSTGIYYPIFASGSSSGNYNLAANSGITANLSNGAIIATTIVGNLTGNVTGNVNGNISGTIVAPGANTQVLFNDSGNVNAISGLTFTKSTNALVATGNITGGNLTTSGALSVTGNANVGNVGAAAGVFTANVTAINVYANSGIVGAGSVLTTSLSSGANTTAGAITGNWTLTAGSRLQATYADLAEYYEADDLYVPGTVVMFGGDKEVTLAEDGTPRVAGVVSTNPAYVMNATCPGLLTAVALQGRVPCKVRGIIKKGDMLISGGNGYARPAQFPSVGTVIGKALQDFNGGEGVVEVAVGRL